MIGRIISACRSKTLDVYLAALAYHARSLASVRFTNSWIFQCMVLTMKV
jgi:hypothetical protein